MYTSKLFFLHVACSPATRGNPQGVKFQEAGGLTVCCMANGDVLFNEIKATRQRGADRKWQGGVVRFPQRCITGCSVHPCAYVNGLNRLLTKSKTWSATVKRNTCGTQLSSSKQLEYFWYRQADNTNDGNNNNNRCLSGEGYFSLL